MAKDFSQKGGNEASLSKVYPVGCWSLTQASQELFIMQQMMTKSQQNTPTSSSQTLVLKYYNSPGRSGQSCDDTQVYV
jgi:hypothetical protein